MCQSAVGSQAMPEVSGAIEDSAMNDSRYRVVQASDEMHTV